LMAIHDMGDVAPLFVMTTRSGGGRDMRSGGSQVKANVASVDKVAVRVAQLRVHWYQDWVSPHVPAPVTEAMCALLSGFACVETFAAERTLSACSAWHAPPVSSDTGMGKVS
jgi:hypothetical protein